MSVTLTGDNNYTGTYDDVQVLGGANSGGNTDYDTTIGDETFMFGNLQQQGAHHAITTDTSGDVTSGTWNSTATGSSNDTLHFGFTFHNAVAGGTSNFLTSGDIPNPAHFVADGDGDANYTSTADDSAWTSNYTAWQATQPPGTTYSDSTVIETGVSTGHPDGTGSVTLDVLATSPGGTPASETADHAGAKVLLGFSVGSDHIALDTVTQDQFNSYFNVTSTTHISTNGNVVHDTTITLTDGSGHDLTGGTAWSVDLYGVDSTAIGDASTPAGEQALQTWAWNNVITDHPV